MIPSATGGLLQYSNIPHTQTPTRPPSTPPIGKYRYAYAVVNITTL